MKTYLSPFLAICSVSGAAHAIDIAASGATGTQVNFAGIYTQNFNTLPDTTQPIVLGHFRPLTVALGWTA
jgi:hypothetical protein